MDRTNDLRISIISALRSLPAKVRPKELEVVALMIAEHPAMSAWVKSDKVLDFGDMKT